MPTEVFQLTAADLARKIMPKSGEYTFKIDDDDGDMTEEHALDILGVAEDQVLMRLPYRYVRLLSDVDGEFLTRCAAGGETSLRTGLYPITSITLYRNYTFAKGWKTRSTDEAMSSDLYSTNLSTGEITLNEPLAYGDTLIATYAHTAASKLVGLRDCALSIAATETARQFAYFRSADGFDRFEAWERSAYLNLNQMKGVDLLDRLDLLDETENENTSFSQILAL